ncbi:hypothetical protein JMJ35_010284 [Cladonia borealis]|uniref:Rhodopsin domain-containing protein n=1 Tax=Cladonia borealis TaxID=184061 RepID=A0AA39QSU0_9LECA|nr:hypothetical protein JMJ35_010284 [Cladonia borealis]
MADLGLSPPPGGDEDRGHILLIVGSIFATVATVTILSRLLTRAMVVKSFGLDDLFINLGAISMIAVAVIGLYLVRYGVGRHQYYVSLTPGLSSKIFKLTYVLEVLIVFSVTFVRLSVAMSLFRIFGHRRIWKLILYSVMIWILLLLVINLVIDLATCKPIKKLWDPLSPGTCWDAKTQAIVGAAIGAANALADFILAFLPTVFMWDVQMHARTKAGICILMGMGVFTGACDVLRVVQLQNVNASDWTWTALDLYIWAFLEDTVGIIAACIPTLRPLFSRPACYPSSIRTFINKVTSRSSKSQSESTHRLNKLSNMRPPPTSHSSSSAKGRVSVEGGQCADASDEEMDMEWY